MFKTLSRGSVAALLSATLLASTSRAEEPKPGDPPAQPGVQPMQPMPMQPMPMGVQPMPSTNPVPGVVTGNCSYPGAVPMSYTPGMSATPYDPCNPCAPGMTMPVPSYNPMPFNPVPSMPMTPDSTSMFGDLTGFNPGSGSGVAGFTPGSGSGVAGFTPGSGSGVTGFTPGSGSGVAGFTPGSGSGVAGFSPGSGTGVRSVASPSITQAPATCPPCPVCPPCPQQKRGLFGCLRGRGR